MKYGRPSRLTFTLLDTAHNHSSTVEVRIKIARDASRETDICIYIYIFTHIYIHIHTYMYTLYVCTYTPTSSHDSVQNPPLEMRRVFFTVTIILDVHSSFEAELATSIEERSSRYEPHISIRILISLGTRCDDTGIFNESKPFEIFYDSECV